MVLASRGSSTPDQPRDAQAGQVMPLDSDMRASSASRRRCKVMVRTLARFRAGPHRPQPRIERLFRLVCVARNALAADTGMADGIGRCAIGAHADKADDVHRFTRGRDGLLKDGEAEFKA
jgi:hypothetical protein